MKTRSIWVALAMLMASGASVADDAMARAEEIHMGRCFLCHGVEGESATELYPRLAGQHARYVAKQLADFKAGRRQSDTMVDMVEDLTEDDMLALGKLFESKPTRSYDVSDQELARVGEFIFRRGNEYSGVAPCMSCHGEDGHGSANLPRLAGQVPQYIANQLRAFDQRRRTNDNAIMHSIAAKLTQLEIEAVAQYVSGL